MCRGKESLHATATVRIEQRELTVGRGTAELGQDSERIWFGGSERAQVAGMESRFHVFGYLFSGLEIHLVNGVLVEFAIVGRVVATNLGTGLVNTTAMIRLEMFAIGVNQQVPRFVLDEDRGAVV